MGADTPPGMEHNPGDNIAVSLSGDDGDELRGYWEKLSDGGTVTVPLEKQMWGDEFGMCTDRFGIAWMVNISPAAGLNGHRRAGLPRGGRRVTRTGRLELPPPSCTIRLPGDDRGHDLADGSGLRRGGLPVGEQQVPGPDQRGSERVDVGVRRDPAQVTLGGEVGGDHGRGLGEERDRRSAWPDAAGPAARLGR